MHIWGGSVKFQGYEEMVYSHYNAVERDNTYTSMYTKCDIYFKRDSAEAKGDWSTLFGGK